MVIIPLPTAAAPNRKQSVALDGAAFIFTFAWSGRGHRWTMSLADARGEDLIVGVPLVPYIGLLRTLAKDERPGGALHLITPGGVALTRDNVNSASLVYVTEAEVDAV